jgi:SAM-dependent methyltransferase
MAQSRLNDHNIRPDQATLSYHLKQWDEPYRSTVHFHDFIADQLSGSRRVVDLGCGAGAAIGYIAHSHPEVDFLGIDISDELIGLAEKAVNTQNLIFEVENFENLKVRFGIDGVTMMQTLHTLSDPAVLLHLIATRLRPKWVALSTLIYEGNIDCRIVVSEPLVPRMQFYNIFGLPGLRQGMDSQGYKLGKYQAFKIDADLPKPNNPDIMSTYTINTDNGRLQCSGPLILPWGFAMFERKTADD